MPKYHHRKVSTRARITFYTDDEEIVIDGSNPRIGGIVACTTSKNFGPASGEFTFSIKRKPDKQASFMSHFSDPENVYVYIEWLRDGVAYDGMWGMTDVMREDVVRSEDGSRVETITVTGRDVGKIFEMLSLFINIYEQMADGTATLPMIPVYTAFADSLIGSPSQLVRKLVDAWVGNNGVADKQFVLPAALTAKIGARTFYEWMDLSKISEALRGKCYDPNLLNVEGQNRKLWDTVQEYANPLLNEVWVDLAMNTQAPKNGRYSGMKPALFVRERPFPTIKSRERWLALPSYTLTLEDVKTRNIVSDGNERFNYWLLRALSAQADDFAVQCMIQQSGGPRVGMPGNVPIYDIDSIRRHGLRKFEQSTRYLPINHSVDASNEANADPVDWLSVSRTWLRIVHDWYVIAPFQYTGSIESTYLRPEIRIGSRLLEHRYDEVDWEYYVEGVEHTYTYPGSGNSTFKLTRGQPTDAMYLQQQYAKYVGTDIASLSDRDDLIAANAEATSEDASTTPPANADGNNIVSVDEQVEATRVAATTQALSAGSTPAVGLSRSDALIQQLVNAQVDAYMGDQSAEVTPPSPEEEAPIMPADFTGTGGATSTAPEDGVQPQDEVPIILIEEEFVIRRGDDPLGVDEAIRDEQLRSTSRSTRSSTRTPRSGARRGTTPRGSR